MSPLPPRPTPGNIGASGAGGGPGAGQGGSGAGQGDPGAGGQQGGDDAPKDGGGGEEAKTSSKGGRRKSERKAFLLRLPPELMADLRSWANQDLRSLNGHIEFLLREALRKRKGRGGAPD